MRIGSIASSSGDAGSLAGFATVSDPEDQTMRAENDNSARWSRLLAKPLPLPGGSTLKTLSDAGAYILALPKDKQEQDSWQDAVDLLLKAASDAGSVMEATIQIERALSLDLAFAAERPATRPQRSLRTRLACAAAVIKLKERFADISARSAPLKNTMAQHLRDWKSSISTVLGLPEDTAPRPFHTKGVRRGLYIGLASALILGVLILPLLQDNAAIFGFMFFGSIAVLALFGLTALLIMDLLD